MTHFWAAHCSVPALVGGLCSCSQFLPGLCPKQSQLLLSQLLVWVVYLFLVFPTISWPSRPWIPVSCFLEPSPRICIFLSLWSVSVSLASGSTLYQALPLACFSSSSLSAPLLPVPSAWTRHSPCPQLLERAPLPCQEECPPAPSAKGSLPLCPISPLLTQFLGVLGCWRVQASSQSHHQITKQEIIEGYVGTSPGPESRSAI